MAESSNYANNSQTIVVGADEFSFEAVEQPNAQATVIRFEIDGRRYHAGDMLLVLSGSDIHFHGMIGSIEDNQAIATDRRGSLLPATVQ